LETLAALGAHLKRWNPDEVDVEVSVQDRGGKEQRVTLRTTLPGLPPLVAVAYDRDLTRALGEAKRELIRQIDHHKSAREPMNSRQLRSETIRHPKQLGESPSSRGSVSYATLYFLMPGAFSTAWPPPGSQSTTRTSLSAGSCLLTSSSRPHAVVPARMA
jgi:ribosome-associated translation inhibitor RaiA